MIYIRQLLDANELTQIKSMITGGEWVSGTATTDHNNLLLKNNLEYSSDIEEVSQILYNSLDRDRVFIRKVAAKSTTRPIISRTIEGGFYRPHQDMHSIGQYSTTVFLNSPDEYDGGYLRIYDHEIEEYKLDAGYAVTYKTGLIHEVSEVTRGKRDVSVFWTHSYFKPDYLSDIYAHLNMLNDILSFDERPTSIEEAIKHPGFMLETIKENYSRTIDTLE